MIILRQKSFNRKYAEALKELPWWKRVLAQRERGFVLEGIQSDKMADYMASGFLGPREDRVARTVEKAVKNKRRQEQWVFKQAFKEKAKRAAKKASKQQNSVFAPAGA